jgi:hypothetical protein
MIKSIPGWLNFLGLWVVYFLIGWGLDALCGWHTDKRFIAFYSAMFCGVYLAKWRWYEGDGWHFW